MRLNLNSGINDTLTKFLKIVDRETIKDVDEPRIRGTTLKVVFYLRRKRAEYQNISHLVGLGNIEQDVSRSIDDIIKGLLKLLGDLSDSYSRHMDINNIRASNTSLAAYLTRSNDNIAKFKDDKRREEMLKELVNEFNKNFS